MWSVERVADRVPPTCEEHGLQKRWVCNNKGGKRGSWRCRSCYNAKHKLYRLKDRLQALQHYSESVIPKCQCCGESELMFLCIDHIDGGGNDHRRKITNSKNRTPGGGLMYSWLKANGYPPGYRVLCHNCNCAYAYYGTCPHLNRSVVR